MVITTTFIATELTKMAITQTLLIPFLVGWLANWQTLTSLLAQLDF